MQYDVAIHNPPNYKMEKLVERRKYYQRQLYQYKSYMKDLYAKEVSRSAAAQSFSSYTSQEEQQFDVAKYTSSVKDSSAGASSGQKNLKAVNNSTTISSPAQFNRADFQSSVRGREDLTQSQLFRKSIVTEAPAAQLCGISKDLTLSANDEHLRVESPCERKSPGHYRRLLLESRNSLGAHAGAALAAQPARALAQSIKSEIHRASSSAEPERCAARDRQRFGSYQEEIDRTIRQLSKLQRDNELQQKKIGYGALSQMIERYNSLLESQIQKAAQFKATQMRLDYQLQSSKKDGHLYPADQEAGPQTYDSAAQTDEKSDKETQCRAKRQRKPQLESSLFMARVATFDDSYMCLSQTSQEYLKWRRGQE